MGSTRRGVDSRSSAPRQVVGARHTSGVACCRSAYGVGRVRRAFVRSATDHEGLEIVAVDVVADLGSIATLPGWAVRDAPPRRRAGRLVDRLSYETEPLVSKNV